MSKRFVFLLAAAAAMVFSAGCGRKDSAAPSAGGSSPESGAASAARSFELSANDTMKFDVTRIEVKAGEPVRVVLRNTGSQPKAAMGHNFVLLKAGVNAEQFANAAIGAGAAADYFPKERLGDVLAHTKLIGPRETAEVSFTAPTPGEYAYICTFPGHFMLGMKGVLVVQ